MGQWDSPIRPISVMTDVAKDLVMGSMQAGFGVGRILRAKVPGRTQARRLASIESGRASAGEGLRHITNAGATLGLAGLFVAGRIAENLGFSGRRR